MLDENRSYYYYEMRIVLINISVTVAEGWHDMCMMQDLCHWPHMLIGTILAWLVYTPNCTTNYP